MEGLSILEVHDRGSGSRLQRGLEDAQWPSIDNLSLQLWHSHLQFYIYVHIYFLTWIILAYTDQMEAQNNDDAKHASPRTTADYKEAIASVVRPYSWSP